MIISQDEARRRVAAGAAYLDRTLPGWHDRIDVGTLTLHEPCGCIMGQLAHVGAVFSFNKGLRLLGIPLMDCARYGFDYTVIETVDQRPLHASDYQPLQDAWIEAIADRRLRQTSSAEQTVHAAVPVLV